MATIHSKIEEYVGRTVDFYQEVQIFNDGNGNVTIGKWDIDGVEEPTMEQLDALDTKANTRDSAKQLEFIRMQRNDKLAESDWTQSPDSPLTDTQKTSWATYRQSLRDITDGATTLDAVKWPTKPE